MQTLPKRRTRWIVVAMLAVAASLGTCLGGYWWSIARDRPMFHVYAGYGPRSLYGWRLLPLASTKDGHGLLADEELNLLLVLRGVSDRATPWTSFGATPSDTTIEVPYERGVQKLTIHRQRNRMFVVYENGTHSSHVMEGDEAKRIYEEARRQESELRELIDTGDAP